MRSLHFGTILFILILYATLLSPGCTTENRATIKVGAIYPLSGPAASAGKDIRNGILLAVDIVNNKYDLDLPLAGSTGIPSPGGAEIEVIFADSRGDPDTGRLQAQKLIDEKKVAALVGCYHSAVTAEASRVAEERGVPFLTLLSTAPGLTQRGYEWFFSTTPDEEVFVRNFFLFLDDMQVKTGKKADRLAIVHEDSVWGAEIAGLEKQYAGEYGYTIAADISYSADTKNVDNEVHTLRDTGPDAVLHASYSDDAILFIKTYKALGFTPSAILADNAGFVDPRFTQSLGRDSDYICTRMTWCKDLAESNPLIEEVNQLYQARYGTGMDDNSARAFTGALVLFEAINRAGSTGPDAIGKALIETDIPAGQLIMPWDGVRFDPYTHRNSQGKGIICQITGGEYYTVWPWNMATRELVWPMPEWAERE